MQPVEIRWLPGRPVAHGVPTSIQTVQEVGARVSATDDDVLAKAWAKALAQFPTSTRALVKHVTPSMVNESLVLIPVANDFARNRLETEQRTMIEDLLWDTFSRQVQIAVTVEPDQELDLLPPEPPAVEEVPVTGPTGSPGEARTKPTADSGSPLHPRYTFDNFVVGESNRMAHAAATRVAEEPGTNYNPLMIYGPSGLGKTHLLHAIGHFVREFQPDLVVRYVSTEEMTNEFINAIQQGTMAAFRRAYRDVDVLLIDDIQILEGKDQTQEEFFHTFNTLYNAQKQIVMTSDRAPKDLKTLDDRLRSRFEWGLTTDMQLPSVETRLVILRRKVASDNLQVPDDVLEFIAATINTNIRELEGALLNVSAHASLDGRPVNMDVARAVMADVISTTKTTQVSPEQIIAATAEYFGITVEELTGTSRVKAIIIPRQIAMYLCRQLTDRSLPAISKPFNKDHTTVMHNVDKVAKLIAEDRSVYSQVNELTNRITTA
ncbi:chromosomal replication initiator protein DnaA [Propionibacterium sp. oral taxon 192 str. F0372]|uniref:chromosomal replication initiator protein DnaA n=1 Tax=Propionibacterium sp. oral taxon 192 TaxID=671222 RepID=UPI00035307CB|nr:chromosomal replication initiator protein DnaA [Propionibacterium sp. oral taxon 192 str. F0372]